VITSFSNFGQKEYIRGAICFIPGTAVLIACFFVCIGKLQDYKKPEVEEEKVQEEKVEEEK